MIKLPYCNVKWQNWVNVLVMKKLVYTLYEQLRRRPACTPTQSDQINVCSLPGSIYRILLSNANFKDSS